MPALPLTLRDDDGLIAGSEAMRRVVALARRVARVDSTVLVTGESGVGKERVASLVHRASSRATAPFVAVNCGAMTETLLESELFGHARGAFTGAASDRAGLFESAVPGTLFLDEVGETSPGMQAKLLRALQEREIRRVGESVARPVDVRVLAATNRDLAAEVAAGRFRRDLFYRLRVVELAIPPLRDRPDDILPIAREVLARLSTRDRRSPLALAPRAAELLERHAWPGNVRELENALERAAALCDGDRLEPEDLPDELRTRPGARASESGMHAAPRTLAEIERAAILAALARHGGNQSKTAAELGIGTATLYRKLKRWGALGRRTPSPRA
jgi:two-component system, NtrC family, response regulator HydG